MVDLSAIKSALDELIQAAHAGQIVPVRLPGQLEAIQQNLLETERAQSTSSSINNVETLQEMGEFTRIAIHEMRTPITSIRGYSDMLANSTVAGELNAMQQQLLAVVRSNTIRVEQLLKDLSQLNKIRTGILVIHKNMDLFKNIAQMVEQATEPIALKLNRRLEFDIPLGLPLLNTDSELLALALTKLIENGLRYTRHADPYVRVSATSKDNDLVITITDNGIGMSQDEINQLGTIYFRSRDELVHSYKGSGLGIPIAYGLFEALNITCKVESEAGTGTTFVLVLQGMD